LVAQAERAELENSQIPSSPNLSEVDTAEMKHFLGAIRLILSSVGLDILEPKRIESTVKDPKEEIIYEFSVRQLLKIDLPHYLLLKR